MQLLPRNLDLPIVLVEHNIEYSLDLQRTFLSRSSQDFFSSWREYYFTFFWERTFWRGATKVIALTAEDQATIKRLEPNVDVQIIPNGIDHEPSIVQLRSYGRKNFLRIAYTRISTAVKVRQFSLYAILHMNQMLMQQYTFPSAFFL
jgi:glycosyltransferase involved in cell wall biosynthesis